MCAAFRWLHLARATGSLAPSLVLASSVARSEPDRRNAYGLARPPKPLRAESCPSAPTVTNWGDPNKAAKLEANYKKVDVVRQRSEIMRMLRPLRGERILDIGCGPGLVTYDLAVAVGESGSVDGLDPSDAMCTLARERLGCFQHVAVQIGSAEALPYNDSAFDAVVLSQVLLYVQDVPLALREVRRVLRPGGRLLICDTDWNSLVVNTGDKDRFDRIFAACCSTFVHAHLPPQLPGMLTHAGMPVCEISTLGMTSFGDQIEGTFMENWAFNVVPEKAGSFGLGEDDVQSWLDEQRELLQRGAFFACVHRFVFLARRP